jgi:hypothetical protein
MSTFKMKNENRFLGLNKNNSFRLKALSLVMLLMISFGCKKIDEAAPGPDGTSATKLKTDADETFYIAALPDTQYYTDPGSGHGGTMTNFKNQIDWIVENKTTSNIQYVAHLGDITNHGDYDGTRVAEWTNAKNQLYRLDGVVPYGLAVGNHDQWCLGDPGEGATNDGYGAWFGKDHFIGYSWYGDPYGSSNNNDNHYDTFTVFGQKFLVLYIEFNQQGYSPGTGSCAGFEGYSATIETNVKNWANGIIAANTDKKVIIVSHSLLNPHHTGVAAHDATHSTGIGTSTENSFGNFTTQGQYIYDNIARPNTNVFMMLCGHVTGDGYREETQNGHKVKVFLSDYQDRTNGGNGYMRIMKFNMTQGTISVRTIQPLPGSNNEEMDPDSHFTVSMFN